MFRSGEIIDSFATFANLFNYLLILLEGLVCKGSKITTHYVYIYFNSMESQILMLRSPKSLIKLNMDMF